MGKGYRIIAMDTVRGNRNVNLAQDTNKLKEIHETLRRKDPIFYAKLGAWYRKNGELRDHNEVFASMLITDPFTDNREVGLALFREHAPFLKTRILGFIKGKKIKIRTKTDKKIKVGKKTVSEVLIEEKVVGMLKNAPTCLRTEVAAYLKWLEENIEAFDAVSVKNLKHLKTLYCSFGFHPKTKRATDIIFNKKYPKDSKRAVFAKISSASPADAAKMIVENKIPFTTAVGLVDTMTPSVLIALVNSMSPQELINNIASLKEKGAFDNPALKVLIESKLDKAKKSGNVSTLKSKTAKNTGRINDAGIEKKLDDVADAQAMKRGTISADTAIFIDKSGSLDKAIEVGKQVAALISGVAVSKLHVLCFDTAARVITATGKTLSDWERAFKGINADGGTSIGAALDYLIRMKARVDQIIVITDEDENADPYFHTVYPRYVKEFGVSPRVVIINGFGPKRVFRNFLTSAKIEHEVYEPKSGDYYGLPGLIPLLGKNSKLDLIYSIMEEPLPKRKPFRV